MQNFYLAELKKDLFTSVADIKYLFFSLILYVDVVELKTYSDFPVIVDTIKANSSAKEIFTKVAIKLVQKNNLPAIKFLIEDCQFDLSKVNDENHCTLLHGACLYNAKGIVEYLLTKGFDVNAKDVDGVTAIHRVAKFKENAELIPLLKKHGANLNLRDKQGLTPLHSAALHENSLAISELLKAGAKKNIKLGKDTYLDLEMQIKNKIRTVTPLSIPEIQENKQQKLEAEYFRRILQFEFSEQIFQNIMDLLLNQFKTPQRKKAIYFLAAYMLRCFFPAGDANELRLFLLRNIHNQKITLSDACTATVLIINEILPQANIEIIQQLTDITTSLADMEINKSENICEIYNAISTFYLKIGEYKKGEDAAAKGLILLPAESKNNILRAYLFYNQGFNQQYGLAFDSVLESYENAFNLVKDDEEIFRFYLVWLVRVRKYQQAFQACELSNCGEFSEIATIYISFLAGKLTSEETIEKITLFQDLKSIPAEIFALDCKSECYQKLGDYNIALKVNKLSFALSEKLHQKTGRICNSILKRLKTYIECESYIEALIFTEDCQKKYSNEFNKDIHIKVFAAIIYSANQQIEQAEILIQEVIQKLGLNYPIVVDLYLDTALSMLDKGLTDITSALHYIDIALKINPDDMRARVCKILTIVLSKGNEQLFKMLEDANISKKFIASLINADLKNEKNIEIKIHQFFQEQKKQLASKLTQGIVNSFEPKTQWKVGDKLFVEDELNIIPIDSEFFRNYYAVIDIKLGDEKTLEKFQIALSKGLCKRDFHQNGIKFLKNSVFELKIDADNRLYTTCVYKNNDNKFLIIFDKKGDHSIIKELLRKPKPLEIIDLAKLPENIKTNSFDNKGSQQAGTSAFFKGQKSETNVNCNRNINNNNSDQNSEVTASSQLGGPTSSGNKK